MLFSDKKSNSIEWNFWNQEMRNINEIINKKKTLVRERDKKFILDLEYQKIRKIKVAGATEVGTLRKSTKQYLVCIKREVKQKTNQ